VSISHPAPTGGQSVIPVTIPAATIPSAAVPPARILEESAWKILQGEHHDAVDELTQGHQVRASSHVEHPVEDFLFTYYSLRPAQLRRWHPGAGVGLVNAPEHDEWRFYRTDEVAGEMVTSVDTARFSADRAGTHRLVSELLPATRSTPGQFGCFGLHEWAMVYRQEDDLRRHPTWPLRLSPADTDAVVEGHQIKCSHFDAFRFFTPAARPRNLLAPDVHSRVGMEQPGCLHANMDLYKWAYKMLPVISSALVLDCFRLTRQIRELDMRASPYDLSALGFSPVKIETTEGKTEYVAAQRRFAEQAAQLRDRLIAALPAPAAAVTG